ncbi:MAG TPA: hypothetical protein VGC46_03610 [Allosphingosinicella sp.]
MTHARMSDTTRRARPARRMLMIGCAAGAVLASGEAAAQSFDATSTVTHGTATITTPPGQTNVNVTSPNAVILWRPLKFGDPVIFQPAGTVATFTGGPGFTVLNRILHQGRIQFDGTVLSRVGGVAGGTVAFSAPNGIIIGSSALFDVGSLILTTLDPVVSPTGQFIDGTGAIDFQPGIPGAEVVTQAGSQITALQDGSFVLMAAPRVVHGGSVLTNGSTAYVAANSAVVRHTSGLFDIFVTSGTTVANPLVHTGRTGGPASTGAGDVHNIYMAAVSEDFAITALVGGTVGYDDSLVATVENGAIILSAFSLGAPATNPAALSIGSGTYTSDVIGASSHNAAVTGDATFRGDLTLVAGTAATVSAEGTVITIGGDLTLVARDPSTPIDPTGGTATLEVLGGGQIDIAGSATIDASGITAIPGFGEIFTDAIGGTAQVRAEGGMITVGGDLRVSADGLATTIEATPDVGGSGMGGTAGISTLLGGNVTVGGNLEATARASAQSSAGNPATPPTATGGNVTLQTQSGGQINVTGTTELRTDAQGGTVTGLAGTTPGLARGGNVRIDVGSGQIQLADTLTIDTRAFGGNGPNGGNAIGGGVIVQASNGIIDIADGSSIDTSAEGGGTFSQPGGTGGNATAGGITVAALNGAEPSLIDGGDLTLTAQGRGGNGGNGQGAVLPGRGGDGSGGIVSVTADRRDGQVQLGALTIDGRGFGGRGGGGDTGQNGAAGGDGFGSVFVSIGTRGESPPSSVTSAGELRLASLDVDSSGTGGAGGASGGAGATGGTGGRGQAGSILLSSESAPVSIDGLARLAAMGTGGAGGLANGGTAGAVGTAHGGELVIASSGITGNPGSLTVGTLDGALDALGDEGTANQGGYFRILAIGSPITFGSATISSSVTGNPASRQPSEITVRNALLTVTTTGNFQSDGDLRISADGTGGIAGGSLGFLSNANISVDHTARPAGQGTIDVTDLFMDAGGNFTSSAGTLIRGTNTVSIDTPLLATIGDQLLGQLIAIRSGDIEIPDPGRIGDASTQQVRLDSGQSDGAARFGGDNVGTGYVLSAAEIGRIRAGRLLFLAPNSSGAANRPPDLLIRGVTIDAGQIDRLSIQSNGIIQVEGALLLSNAGATSLIEMTGDGGADRIQVITPTGSIRVRNTAGAPAGTVRLDADDIWVTDQGLFNQLIADPNFAGRNAALLANSGPADPRGYVEGFDVVLTPLRTLFVQNSGTATDFGGVTVGSSTLTINAGAPGAPADVAMFARGIRSDGSMSIGTAFFFEGVYNGNYTAGSELNLCNIPTRTCPAPPPVEPEEPAFDNPTPSLEEIEEPVGGGDSSMAFAPLQNEDEPIDASAAEPLIEEPVTSGGDSSAWTEMDGTQCQPGELDRARAEGREPICTPPAEEPGNE